MFERISVQVENSQQRGILSRGEDAGKARARAHHIIPIASLGSRAEGDLLCVTVTAEGGTSGPLGWVTVTATHCALGGGQ